MEEIVVELDAVQEHASERLLRHALARVLEGHVLQELGILVQCLRDLRAQVVEPVLAVVDAPDVEVIDVVGGGVLLAAVVGRVPGLRGRGGLDMGAGLVQKRTRLQQELAIHHQRHVIEGVGKLEIGQVAGRGYQRDLVDIGGVAHPPVLDLEVGEGGAELLHPVRLLRAVEAAAADVTDRELALGAAGSADRRCGCDRDGRRGGRRDRGGGRLGRGRGDSRLGRGRDGGRLRCGRGGGRARRGRRGAGRQNQTAGAKRGQPEERATAGGRRDLHD